MSQVCVKRAIEEVVQHSDGDEPTKRVKVNRDNITEHFNRVFKSIESEVMAQMSEMPGISTTIGRELITYYSRCLEYTILGGKMTRGLTVVKGCHVLLGGLTEQQLNQACVLGWSLEWLQAMFLIADDVMDKSITRRGAPCWYKRSEVTEANAINDALLLESMVYQVLRRHFRAESYYARLVSPNCNGRLFVSLIAIRRWLLLASLKFETCSLRLIWCTRCRFKPGWVSTWTPTEHHSTNH
eukprot:c10040_g1_i2.p1 GENE.c10040_g1_i2~~c10040_g1_i2.p1  ORF type:complete len:282 (+),score=44.19 c10040_g1_i2:126-848(+)